MKILVTMLTLFAILCFSLTTVQAQDSEFSRIASFAPDSLDSGGWGNVIAGQDLDNDGNAEMYAINTDWFDEVGLDLVPRIYKYEDDGSGNWSVVWSTRLSLDFQNTWGALEFADLDNDGKMEVVWGPVNNFGGGLQPNPIRIAVFETPGDGSDNMGLDNGDGTWSPNASWTISSGVEENIRPFRWHVYDIDADGTSEIIAGCRAGDGIQIYSTTDVPDNGGMTETWSTEYTGIAGTFYDIQVMNGAAVGIRSNGEVHRVTNVGGLYIEDANNPIGVVGAGSWKSAEAVDVDNDGTEELLVASWNSGTRNVYLVQESGDTVSAAIVATPAEASFRLYGGAAGDADNDGNVDYVFGTRSSTPNGLIHRLEYNGSGNIDDPASWTLSTIDSSVNEAAVQYDIIAMADIIGNDGRDDVIHSGTARSASSGGGQPIVVLESMVVGIGDNPALARGFALRQNYPNPFNPETSIEFTVPQNVNVSLVVYNTLGQKVRSLVNESRSAGTHTVKWDGRDNAGAKVASGLYIYTLRAGQVTMSKKMTILK